jgi:hypothetical protein
MLSLTNSLRIGGEIKSQVGKSPEKVSQPGGIDPECDDTWYDGLPNFQGGAAQSLLVAVGTTAQSLLVTVSTTVSQVDLGELVKGGRRVDSNTSREFLSTEAGAHEQQGARVRPSTDARQLIGSLTNSLRTGGKIGSPEKVSQPGGLNPECDDTRYDGLPNLPGGDIAQPLLVTASRGTASSTLQIASPSTDAQQLIEGLDTSFDAGLVTAQQVIESLDTTGVGVLESSEVRPFAKPFEGLTPNAKLAQYSKGGESPKLESISFESPSDESPNVSQVSNRGVTAASASLSHSEATNLFVSQMPDAPALESSITVPVSLSYREVKLLKLLGFARAEYAESSEAQHAEYAELSDAQRSSDWLRRPLTVSQSTVSKMVKSTAPHTFASNATGSENATSSNLISQAVEPFRIQRSVNSRPGSKSDCSQPSTTATPHCPGGLSNGGQSGGTHSTRHNCSQPGSEQCGGIGFKRSDSSWDRTSAVSASRPEIVKSPRSPRVQESASPRVRESESPIYAFKEPWINGSATKVKCGLN